MTEVYDYYQHHDQMYRHIQTKLDRVRDRLLAVDRPTQQTVLFHADMYALISANTRVEAHEAGYVEALDAESRDGYRDALQANDVLYYNNKADYIDHNLGVVDYDRQAERLQSGQIDAVHHEKLDTVLGLGTLKAAFSLAMCGFDEKMCIDANVASYFGLDTDEDVYDGVVIDDYERQCGRLRSLEPQLASETSPFVFFRIPVVRDCGRQNRDKRRTGRTIYIQLGLTLSTNIGDN
jgi:thermostable 8-oxoguanine DNA glycosylase